jgi:hypothetical protein
MIIARLFALAFALLAFIAQPASAQQRRFGVIEIGGSGVKASVVEIVTAAPDNDLDLRLVREYPVANVNPIQPDRQQAVAGAVSELVNDMRDRYALSPLQIYVVASSGIESAPHADALRASVDAAIAGRAGALTYISALDQARLGFEGVVNCERLAHRRVDTLYIDIGSSEISGAAASGGDPSRCGDETVEAFGLGFGVKNASGSVQSRITDALDRTNADALYRPRVYLGGGIVWALATFAHPENAGRFVPLAAADIDAFRNQLAADPLCITDPTMAQRSDPQCRFMDVDFSSVRDVNVRVRASADHREIVSSIYTLDQLRTGADILSTLSTSVRFRDRRLFFARNSVRAWALGFLLLEEAGER